MSESLSEDRPRAWETFVSAPILAAPSSVTGGCRADSCSRPGPAGWVLPEVQATVFITLGWRSMRPRSRSCLPAKARSRDGQRLYETQPTFRKTPAVRPNLAAHLDQPLLSVLYPKAGETRAWTKPITQPALLPSVCLAAMWQSWGISDALLGTASAMHRACVAAFSD